MIIKTKDYGITEISKNDIIHFTSGILGFEDTTEYVLLQKKDNPVLQLQSISGETPRFIVFKPESIVKGYRPEIPASVLECIKAGSAEQISIFVIAVVPDNIKDMTVNLKSPVIVNNKERLAVQVVLDSADYSMRHHVFSADQEVS